MNDTADIRNSFLDLARPIVESLGLEIWGLDIIGGPRTKVCLYVDVPPEKQNPEKFSDDEDKTSPYPKEKSFSANIEQCEDISRRLGLALDVEDFISGPWNLEVSSPGLERKFFSLEQMRPFIGDLLDVRLIDPLEEFPERRSFRGILCHVADSAFEIESCSLNESGEILPENMPRMHIPWEKVKWARRLHIFDVPQKPGKKRAGKAK